jgi:mannose-1-phosphate guanylyltransferase
MKSKNNYVVIMAGGIGSRFWPFSRNTHPKQFHDILGTGQTMIQQTVARFQGICPMENIYVVTNKIYQDKVKEQLPLLSDDQILLEPVARNTAPCVAYAAYKIYQKNPAANIVVAPSDHVILKEEEFRRCIEMSLSETDQNPLIVTLGIKPHRPDTGYGYIQFLGKSYGELHKVKTFTEKPNQELALQFIESGDFVWNAGIFVFNAKTIIDSFEAHLPDMADLFKQGNGRYYAHEEAKFIDSTYALCKSISIDYGIMEKAKNVHVLLCDFGWSDLGTWKSLYDISSKDDNGNVLKGSHLLYESKNCIVRTPKDRLVIMEGVEDLIVAEHENVLMICKKDSEQRVKEFLGDAKEFYGEDFV